MKYGLTDEAIDKIISVLSRHKSVDRVIIYGSRAMQNHKPHSDIDLTIVGENLDSTLLNKLADDLDDLLLPITFDLSLKDQISNRDLITHIDKVGQVLYQRL